MSQGALAALISPMRPEEFLESSWPHEPFVIHGLNQTIRELRALPFLESLEALLGTWRGTVQAHLPDVSDESSSVSATPHDSRKLFANKMGLLFNNAHEMSPVLTGWLNSLKDDLGLPNSTHARCMIYATPDGKGTAAHFDQNVNFVLQLHGIKRWWLAPNQNVLNPTQRHTIGQPLDPELASYISDEMPTSLPAHGRREFVLEPGSMLFVPRGYWHSTEARGEALALNFTFCQPTWVDLFTLALRSRLQLSPEWRELADGVRARNPERRALAELKLDSLLTELVHDLPHWQAADILGATEGDLSEGE